jgi:hypothetical protein
MDKIFIAIPAIDEIDVKQTITSALENAKYPDRITFGLCVQYQQYPKDSFKEFKNIKIVELSSDEILGVGVVRKISYMLHNGEKYFMQIDAHMLFDKNWDENLIKYYIAAKKISDKIIFSGYVPAWYRDKQNNIVKDPINKLSNSLTLEHHPQAKQPTASRQQTIEKIESDGLVLHKQKAISCHFIFSESDFIYNFLPDPFIIYNGDEATLSLRAISRGYLVFSPEEAILWHLDKRLDNFYSNEPFRWQPLFLGKQEARSDREIFICVASYNRVKDIFNGSVLGYYGARSIEDITWYSNYIGIDFQESFI